MQTKQKHFTISMYWKVKTDDGNVNVDIITTLECHVGYWPVTGMIETILEQYLTKTLDDWIEFAISKIETIKNVCIFMKIHKN